MLSFRREVKYCPYCGSLLTERDENGVKRLYCPTCKIIIYKNPVPVVALVVLNSKKEILLIKRKVEPKRGKWALPSGFIELYEEPESAAQRELEEETGIKVDKLKLLNVYHQLSQDYESVLVIAFLSFSDSFPQAGDDAEDAKFYPPDEAIKLVCFQSHLRAIKDALKTV